MLACPTQAATMKQILSDYAALIGLHTNFHKSPLIPINTPDTLYQNIATIFGCTVGKMPFTYLGLPLGTTRPSVQDLMPMVCRAERRITAAMPMMSYAGKLSLVNSWITSIAMCTIRLNPKVVAQLEKIRRHCRWIKKSDQGTKSNSLAAWDLVCRPKKHGGLGIINLKNPE